KSTARVAEDATGRDMKISNISVTAQRQPIDPGTGVVRYTFDWEGFSDKSGNRMTVGDALNGIFLDNRTKMVISWDGSLEPRGFSPQPDEKRTNAAVWEGPMEFSMGSPVLTFRSTGFDFGTPVVVGVVLLAVLGIGGGGLYLRRRRGHERVGEHEPRGEDKIAERGKETETEIADHGQDVEEFQDSELLTNEERVINLLERKGGRIKQQDIVGELDWTEAKTSQVVNKMKDNDEVEVYRLGRENIVSLPGERDDMGEE
ncbi:MAG: hypothetical protein SXQ77_12465, partial [Halobacteria archaeon]|nr:hypothetical protein [Halobacteria archaeon]